MSVFAEQILDTIDELDSFTLESMINVYNAMSAQYEKLLIMNDGHIEFVMEGDVMDYATGKYTLDGALKKMILFIPRLLIGIAKSIANVFTGNYKSEKDASYKNAVENLAIADQEDLNAAAAEVAKISNGDIAFDPKTKKLGLLGKFKDMRHKIAVAKKTKKIMNRIRNEAVNTHTDYKALASEIAAILKKDKKIDSVTTSITLEAFNTLLDDAAMASDGVGDLAAEASKILDKKIQEELAKGEKLDKTTLDDMKLLSDQISKMSGNIGTVSKFGKFGKKTIDFFGQDASRAVGKYTPFLRHTKGFKTMAMKGATGSENWVRAGKGKGVGLFRKIKSGISDITNSGESAGVADAESEERMTEARVRGKAEKVKQLEQELKFNGKKLPPMTNAERRAARDALTISKYKEKTEFARKIEDDLDSQIAKLEQQLAAKNGK